MKQVVKVTCVATWDGWCSPCTREDRPLILTRIGPAGVRAWVTGHTDEDRRLLLTCRVCGQWQVVPLHEEDDPEVYVVEDDVLDAVAELVAEHRAAAQAPAGDRAVPQEHTASPLEAAVAALVPAHVAAPAAPSVEEPAPEHVVDPEVAAAARVMLRGLLNPTLADVSPQDREATLGVLAAARAAEQPAAADPARPAPLDRARRRQTGPTPRRPERPAVAVRVPRPRAATPPAATSIDLPDSTALTLLAGGHQVVLAAG